MGNGCHSKSNRYGGLFLTQISSISLEPFHKKKIIFGFFDQNNVDLQT